ncbi:MAG: hypothetical protein EBX41_06260 [Chitinophagia bacterium]|nr:hypothetical protein [Chitinophagia bacterium]
MQGSVSFSRYENLQNTLYYVAVSSAINGLWHTFKLKQYHNVYHYTLTLSIAIATALHHVSHGEPSHYFNIFYHKNEFFLAQLFMAWWLAFYFSLIHNEIGDIIVDKSRHSSFFFNRYQIAFIAIPVALTALLLIGTRALALCTMGTVHLAIQLISLSGQCYYTIPAHRLRFNLWKMALLMLCLIFTLFHAWYQWYGIAHPFEVRVYQNLAYNVSLAGLLLLPILAIYKVWLLAEENRLLKTDYSLATEPL